MILEESMGVSEYKKVEDSSSISEDHARSDHLTENFSDKLKYRSGNQNKNEVTTKFFSVRITIFQIPFATASPAKK